jgi:hypothetical protein
MKNEHTLIRQISALLVPCETETLAIAHNAWHSLCYNGLRYELSLFVSGTHTQARVTWLEANLPEHEFNLSNAFVAEASVATTISGRSGARVELEILVIDD